MEAHNNNKEINMKNILMVAALVSLVGGSVFAQETTETCSAKATMKEKKACCKTMADKKDKKACMKAIKPAKAKK